jgi:stage II sporulation protein P
MQHVRVDGEKIKNWIQMGRLFVLLALLTMTMVVTAGLYAILYQQNAPATSTMKGLTASIAPQVFTEMLALEMPRQERDASESLTSIALSRFVLQMLTDVDPVNPASLLASEYPNLVQDNTVVVLHPGITGAPKVANGNHDDNVVLPEKIDWKALSAADDGDGSELARRAAEDEEAEKLIDRTLPEEAEVFIYHSHNWESWYSELPPGTEDPSSHTENVTLLGERLQTQLAQYGVNAAHSATNYPGEIPGYRSKNAYNYSEETVREALADNEELKMIFDLHRDAAPRESTTITIGGVDYARLFFVIGMENPDFRENEAFAEQIQTALNQDYPGLSKGILGKNKKSGDGEYNQSLSPGSVLIEIGGQYNTLEESNRTIDALAKVIAEIYTAEFRSFAFGETAP